jgi:hypothetical protein
MHEFGGLAAIVNVKFKYNEKQLKMKITMTDMRHDLVGFSFSFEMMGHMGT